MQNCRRHKQRWSGEGLPSARLLAPPFAAVAVAVAVAAVVVVVVAVAVAVAAAAAVAAVVVVVAAVAAVVVEAAAVVAAVVVVVAAAVAAVVAVLAAAVVLAVLAAARHLRWLQLGKQNKGSIHMGARTRSDQTAQTQWWRREHRQQPRNSVDPRSQHTILRLDDALLLQDLNHLFRGAASHHAREKKGEREREREREKAKAKGVGGEACV